MARDRKLDSFILKKMDYGEADQIITLFTREEGKVRVLVKAAKLPTSKLQPMLQPLFETRVTLTGTRDSAGMGKVTGVQLIEAFSGVLGDETKMAAWYVVSELLIRSLPDQAPNDALFEEFRNYARFLHSQQSLTPDQVKKSLMQFQVKAMATLGLGIRNTSSQEGSLWFSMDRGGFTNEEALDAIPIQRSAYQYFQILARDSYEKGLQITPEQLGPLSNLINRFVIHQLERDIKSHRHLANS